MDIFYNISLSNIIAIIVALVIIIIGLIVYNRNTVFTILYENNALFYCYHIISISI